MPDDLSMKKFQIWVEGFNILGGIGQAHMLHPNIWAFSFDQAVTSYLTEYPNPTVERKDGFWYMYGCRLFDNEADARKAFG
jgi:hypothetical protein